MRKRTKIIIGIAAGLIFGFIIPADPVTRLIHSILPCMLFAGFSYLLPSKQERLETTKSGKGDVFDVITAPISTIPAKLVPEGTRFRNPANNYEEDVGRAGLWCLCFGFLYFASKGIWTHALVSAVAAFCTCGISWVIYPFFVRQIVARHYLRKGWMIVETPIVTAAVTGI